MEIGIIGLPNVTKSSLFNILTHANVPAENFPFTTIEPNNGIVSIYDEKLEKLKQIFNPEKCTTAIIKFVDIAGLVKNAHKGEGLGNKFLANIREVDALAHVLRGFSTSSVVNVIEKIDPLYEIEIVTTELILSDLEQVDKRREKIIGLAKCGNKLAQDELEILNSLRGHLNNNNPANTFSQVDEQIKQYNLLTSKPVIYVLNIDEFTNVNEITQKVEAKFCTKMVPINVKLEQEINEFPKEEQSKFRQEFNLDPVSGADCLIKESKKLLKLITFYTVVGTEIRAWLIPVNTTAVDAAGKIHSDMSRGFIRAEIYNYDQLISHGTEKVLREKGLIKTEGKQYIVQESDIVRIMFHT